MQGDSEGDPLVLVSVRYGRVAWWAMSKHQYIKRYRRLAERLNFKIDRDDNRQWAILGRTRSSLFSMGAP